MGKIVTGSFNPKGSPTVSFTLKGTGEAATFEGIIDTGFTGFISLPLLKALPLGLPLVSTTNVTIADGSSPTRLLARATATVGPKSGVGSVMLEPSSNLILLGMTFLRTLGLALVVRNTDCDLYDEDTFPGIKEEPLVVLGRDNT